MFASHILLSQLAHGAKSITYRSAAGHTDDKCQQNEGSHVERWCLKYAMQRYSFIVCYLLRNLLQQESRSTFSPKVVCWINGSLPSFKIVIEEEDFAILLSRSTPYILFENKRPIASASDWLWWPAKFLYRGQKCAFKANIHLCLSQSKILAGIVITWHDIVVQINQTQSENTFMALEMKS